jgi:hypothetical protein
MSDLFARCTCSYLNNQSDSKSLTLRPSSGTPWPLSGLPRRPDLQVEPISPTFPDLVRHDIVDGSGIKPGRDGLPLIERLGIALSRIDTRQLQG